MFKRKRSQNTGEKRVVEIDLHILLSSTVMVLMSVFVLFGIGRFIFGFLSVGDFEIVGESPYTASELAAGADIVKGESLYGIDKKEAKKILLENCAYVERVSIRTSFPNKVKFIVKCYDPVWYLEISGDYYVLDSELNVLEETKNEERLKSEGLIRLTLPNVRTVIVDDVLTFGKGEEEIKATEEIMRTILDSDALFMISSADIDNRYDIHFEFDEVMSEGETIQLEDRFKVSVGGFLKLGVKLDYILDALDKQDMTGVCGGIINIADGGEKVSVSLAYLAPEPDEESEETTVG